MNPQARVQPALGKQAGASDDECDLNQLAKQVLASVPVNILPLEPFPAGFNLGALASSSRSSHPPPAEDPIDGAEDARLDLRGVAPARRSARALRRALRRVVDLAPSPPGQAQPSTAPRVLPPRKRTGVVDLAPDHAAPAAALDDDLEALIAKRAFAPNVQWRAHAAHLLDAANRAPRWSWATAGALAVALIWLVAGSHHDPAAPAPVTRSLASSMETPPIQPAPIASTSLASIMHPQRAFAASTQVASPLAYNRTRPAHASAFTSAPPAATAPVAAAPPVAPATQEGTLDTLLDQALRNEGLAPLRVGHAKSALPSVPARAAVASILGGLLSRVRYCAGGRSGVATAHLVVSHDGRVTSARVTGAGFSSAAAGRCIESVVRGAQFPAFEQSTFSVTYPFQL